MDVKPPLNLAEPCQRDGHQEGLLCFDQHQCAWEHVPNRSPLSVSECSSRASGAREGSQPSSHLSLTSGTRTNIIWRGDWRCAVTQWQTRI